MIRVLIVDDDKLARKGLISIMPWADHDMTVVGEAANGAKALEFMERNEVDLMFVDLSMPVMSGMELLQVARQKFPHLRSVVLSFHEEFENVQTAYRMGVLDYISKVRLESEDDEQVLKRIRQHMTGDTHSPGWPPRTAAESTALTSAPASPLSVPLSAQSAPASPLSVHPSTLSTAASTSPPSAAEPNDRSPEGAQWAELEQEWRTYYWLYNESVFQRLCKQTAAVKVSFRRLEGLLLRVLSHMESVIALEAELRSDVQDVRSALDWLRDYRQRVYARVAASSDCANTTISILKAVMFIREQASNPLHAEQVADHVHMSRSYFSQCFKKLAGMTFNEFLRQERISAAERLLCETNRSIAWVAQAVGYNDSKYFAQLFYEQTRLLPSEFRAQFHRGDE